MAWLLGCKLLIRSVDAESVHPHRLSMENLEGFLSSHLGGHIDAACELASLQPFVCLVLPDTHK